MEFRKDPLTGNWVTFAPERASRPFEYTVSPAADRLDSCPFCRGREALTPDAVLQLDKTASPSDDWSVRVIPNRYPAFTSSAAGVSGQSSTVAGFPQRQDSDVESGVVDFESSPGAGRHEVLIESPEHCSSMSAIDAAQFHLIVNCYQQRLLSFKNDQRLAHAVIFKNQGAAAGASLTHVHSQIVATPFVPKTIDEELDAAVRFRKDAAPHSGSLWSALLVRELRAATRIVNESESFVVLCPFASRFPYETWLIPKRHDPEFTNVTCDELREFSEQLRNTLTALERTLPVPAFNFALCVAPFRDVRSEAYHWHLKVTPRIAGIAGFELGTGSWINIVLPEHAAAALRSAWS